AKPPSPVDRNLRFQVARSGSQTSKLMFESVDGLLTACTRQKAGRLGIVTVSEIFNAPAGTAVDSTTVASPNVRPFKETQAAPELGAVVGRSGLCAETVAAVRQVAAAT